MKKIFSPNSSAVLQGSFVSPGDKSISHRAVMFGSLADGQSHFTHFLEAEDCLCTLQAFRNMGVQIDHKNGSGEISIQGVGLRGLKAPQTELDLGNSGTSMRLLLGILSGQRFDATLTGDSSLQSRPMKRVTVPLKQMGAQIKGRDQGNFAPLSIHGGKLKGIHFENKLHSAQVKSAILFAGMYAETPTTIKEFLTSRDHTERFLKAAGANFSQSEGLLKIEKTETLQPLNGAVPGDISSAAFFIAGAAAIPGSEVTIENVSLNPTRTGILGVLKRMGAQIEIKETQKSPEPLGSITVKGGRLKGTRIIKDEIPSLIDELPIIMTVMALAEGESLVSGAEELRVKETDRIHSMVANLTAIGGDLEELPDGCVIRGVESFQGGSVQSFMDHRTAMSLAIASLQSQGDVIIDDISCVNTSFPGFFDLLDTLKT